MIDITLETALSLYFFAYLGSVFGLWMFLSKDELRKDFYLKDVSTVSCLICAFIYSDKEKFLSKCPRCGSYNKLV